jgi:pentatricopeptide repeat protein
VNFGIGSTKLNIDLHLQIYGVVRKEIWYRPDMYFYRDMLYMLARNKKVDETRQVWADLKSEDVLFDQHTYGDIVRAYTDAGLIDLAMEIYEDMRSSPDPPLSLPFRVILKGLVPYPELREKIKQDFLELFPDMIVYDPPGLLIRCRRGIQVLMKTCDVWLSFFMVLPCIVAKPPFLFVLWLII